MRRPVLLLVSALLAAAVVAPAAQAADPVMHFDNAMKVENVCFTATVPGDPEVNSLFGRRFTDGPVTSSTPVIVLAHGIASSADTWDFSPTWSVARALAAAGYVVIAYDRLGYARSPYDNNRPGGGYALTTSVQRNVLHQLITEAKTGGYATTAANDCNGAKQPSALKNPTAIIIGHSAGGWVVAGYPGEYHDVAAMIQADITGSSAGMTTTGPGGGSGSKGGGFTPDPAHPSYFQFFQTRQNCEDFNLYLPGIVHYAADIACTPPFLDSPYGEITDLGEMYAENDASIKMIGPSTPVLLTSGDHDTTAPPDQARADFAYYQANCGCDVSQYIVPATAHLFMVHASLTAWLDRVETFLASHGLPPTGATGAVAPGAGATPTSGPSSGAGRRNARALTIRVTPKRDRHAPFRFRTSGRLLLFTGSRAATACGAGRVSVQVKAGRRTISTRRARLRADCTFRSTVTFRIRRRLGRSGALRFTARFDGNDAVRAVRSRTRAARAGRPT